MLTQKDVIARKKQSMGPAVAKALARISSGAWFGAACSVALPRDPDTCLEGGKGLGRERQPVGSQQVPQQA